MSDLKQCPCGATPTKLAIVEGSTFRWRVVSGGCCGDWEVEVRVPTVGPEANEEGALAACVREWNAMPRGWEARIAELEADVLSLSRYSKRLEQHLDTTVDVLEPTELEKTLRRSLSK